MLDARRGFTVLMLLALAACQVAPPVELHSELRVSPELDVLRPNNIAVLPIEDATTDEAFRDQKSAFRTALVGALPGRLYAPLAPGWVDERLRNAGTTPGSPVDSAWLGGLRSKFDEDAVLGIRLTRWDTSDVVRNSRVLFSLEVLMLDSKNGERLWTGRLDGSVKAGGDGPAPMGREARILSAAEVLAQALVEKLPARRAGR